MPYLLYKKEALLTDVLPDDSLDVRSFSLTPLSLFVKEESLNLKILLLRLYFSVITLFRAKIFYVLQDGVVVHTSYVIPKCFKFPFLLKDNFEIGPCFTKQEYRGKGIYPNVLKRILKTGNKGSLFYMLVDSSNISSINGIEKAGFVKCGFCEKVQFSIYRMVD